MKTAVYNLAICALLLSSVPMSGCLQWWPEFGIQAGEEKWGELNPAQYYFYSMHDSPAMNDQSRGMTYPAPKTVPVGHQPYPYAASEAKESATLRNPIAPTTENLAYGKKMYETSCVVCHGAGGTGQGYVVPPYPQPPDLTAQRVRDWTDGQIYHVIVNGQGRMWSYKDQLTPMERWAVVNYIRALQRAKYPQPQDLERVNE